jgi:hypothetical protein
MQDVFVIALDGMKLMPTNRAKARKLLKKGKAIIYKHSPFAIQLTYESEKNVQPIEFCEDTGATHIGVSIKSEKHEYVHAQYDHLKDETERHNDQRMYRRTRRNRKRYRKPRFDNRKKPEGWLAPTVEHKKDNHIRIFEMFYDVCPITRAVFETGQFDPAAIQALEETGEILEGTDYQHGKRYGLANLREAVFTRDHYRCRICGKGVENGVILHAHHIRYRSEGGTDRINNLLTVCSKCHTPKNHKPGGKLYGLKPLTGTYKDATFMNIVRWQIINTVRQQYAGVEVENTYGSYTKASRRELGQLEKTHANDAYAMGEFHPKHRPHTVLYRKRRRNDRCLERFYDAMIIDCRDGSIKKGADLGCNRTNRRETRNELNNLRIYRKEKVRSGYRSIRPGRHSIQAGEYVIYKGKVNEVKTARFKNSKKRGIYETLEFKPQSAQVLADKVRILHHLGGWVQTQEG